MKKMMRPLLAVLALSTLGACASAPAGDSATAAAHAERKIGFAIGLEPGSFSIVSQREGQAPGGSVRTDYAVSTRAGATYACYIMEPSRFGKVMSWGMASGSDAVCSPAGGKSTGVATRPTKAACNDLLKAAGKCS